MASRGLAPRRGRSYRAVPGARLSADWRRVLYSAVVPEFVQAPRNAELRMGADVAVEDLAVIPLGADGVGRPGVGEAERLAEIALRADEPLDRWLLRLQRVVDRLRTDAELLGVQKREVHPLDDIEPLHVVLTHDRAQRLL